MSSSWVKINSIRKVDALFFFPSKSRQDIYRILTMDLLEFQSPKIEERKIDRIDKNDKSIDEIRFPRIEGKRERNLDNFHIPRKIRGKLSKGFPPKFLTPTYTPI